MKFVFALSLLFAVSAHAADPLAATAFLRGCWSAPGEPGHLILEDWSRAGSDKMFGVAQTLNLKTGLVTDDEFLAIRWNATQQRPVLSLVRNGEMVGDYPLDAAASSGIHGAVFANPQGAVLKSVTYVSVSPSKMEARVRGVLPNGGPLSLDLTFTRRPCQR